MIEYDPESGAWIDADTVTQALKLKTLQGDTPQEKLQSTVNTILETMFIKAQQGDVGAAKLLLDRGLPTTKASSHKVKLPVLYDTNATLVEKAASINNLMANGHITIETGNALLNGLKLQSDLVIALEQEKEIEEIRQRLDALDSSATSYNHRP